MGRRYLSLRVRFLISIVGGVLLLTLALGWFAYRESRGHLLEARQEHIYSLATAEANELSILMAQVAVPAGDLAALLAAFPQATEEGVWKLLEAILNQNDPLYGMAVAYKPFAFNKDKKLFCPYIHRGRDGLRRISLDTEAYDYPSWDWFKQPLEVEHPVWTEPYQDEGGGNVLMTTYATPFYRNHEVVGVATADVALDRLSEEVATVTGTFGGFGFVVSGRGVFLAGPDAAKNGRKKTISQLADDLKRADLLDLGSRMTDRGTGIIRIIDWHTGEPAWLAFHPIEGPGWSFAIMVPEKEALAPIESLARHEAYIAVAELLGLVIVVWLLVIGLTRPLKKLAVAARRLASGDLETRVEGIKSGDEIGEVADSFNSMVGDLNRYISELTATTAAKERMESELDLAGQIQSSILPTTYPAFPKLDQVDAFARTIPARQVGGDFYDYFMIDDDHLGLVVADVSGKGVPAALFMTISRTLIKNAASHHMDPETALAEVNRQIVPENDAVMFVTVFYGVYRLSTGRLNYASAGHNPPLLRRASGEVEEVPGLGGMAIGVFDDLGLKEGQVDILPGDVLLLYTDGLNEAINDKEEMYELDRAKKWLARTKPTAAPEMIESLIADWLAFTGPVDQFDDLTLMVFTRKE